MKCVREFHQKFNLPILPFPQVPSIGRVTLRLRMMAEEFCETLNAAGVPPAVAGQLYELIGAIIDDRSAPVNFRLPEFVDGLIDQAYINAGTLLEFGVNAEPIEAAVHVANMAKVGGPTRIDGKILKPEDWKAPDIACLLRAQGWKG